MVSLWRAFTALGFPACKNRVGGTTSGASTGLPSASASVVIVNHPGSTVYRSYYTMCIDGESPHLTTQDMTQRECMLQILKFPQKSFYVNLESRFWITNPGRKMSALQSAYELQGMISCQKRKLSHKCKQTETERDAAAVDTEAATE